MGKQIKIAFVQRNPDCALGSMYIASTVKQEAQCRVFIEAYEEDLCSAIQAYEPDIVAFSTFTGEYKDLLAINSEIKKRIDTLSIFGGPHPTYNPDFINEEGVDVICRGEGEYAVLDLVKALKNDEDYFHIKNLHFKTRNGEVLQNEVRHLIGNLDVLEFPDRSIYSQYFHVKGFKDNIIRRVITSRGCPFNCSYCYNHLLKKIYSDKGQLVRVRSVENVINELISLKQEYAAKDCNFVDDLFGMEKSWFKRFAVEYKNRIALPFMCLTHLKYLSEEYIQNLKVAGCKLVCLGIECGNEEYRRNILKRNYKNSYIIEVAKRLREYEIPFFSFNIILLPGETLKMSLETLKLNMKCKPFSAEAFIYQPFPRTDLADYAISNSYYKDDNMAIPNNFFTDSVLDNPDKKKLLRLFYLFSFTTRFRFFYPLVRILICLPFDKLYKTIHYHYKNEARKYYLHELGASEPKVKFRNILMSLIKVDKEPDFLYHRCKKVNA